MISDKILYLPFMLRDFAYTYTLRDNANPSNKRKLQIKVTMANFKFSFMKRIVG